MKKQEAFTVSIGVLASTEYLPACHSLAGASVGNVHRLGFVFHRRWRQCRLLAERGFGPHGLGHQLPGAT
jgi:hypothetical protein